MPAGGEPIATFTHDQGGVETLYGYWPEPAEQIRQGEQIANKLYGIIDTRSPKTNHICVWRDTDPTRFRAGPDAGPPNEILLACGFGTDPWTPPTNLAQLAAQAMVRDEARVAMGWSRRGEGYALTRLEVSVTNLAAGRDFRSVWYDDEVAELDLRQQDIVFPASPADPLTFAITASLPRRYNRREAPKAPTATFNMAGRAAPIPDWVLY